MRHRPNGTHPREAANLAQKVCCRARIGSLRFDDERTAFTVFFVDAPARTSVAARRPRRTTGDESKSSIKEFARAVTTAHPSFNTVLAAPRRSLRGVQ
jgi:hypothetical protein